MGKELVMATVASCLQVSEALMPEEQNEVFSSYKIVDLCVKLHLQYVQKVAVPSIQDHFD